MKTPQTNTEETPRTPTPGERFWAAMHASRILGNAIVERRNAREAARQEELRPLREERDRVTRDSQSRVTLIRVAPVVVVLPYQGKEPQAQKETE